MAFIEVDLASMTQTLLKQKVVRYLASADELAWQDHYPYCPPLLLFTTTATRAAIFTRVAGQALALAGWRDSERAAAVLRVLTDTNPATFLDGTPTGRAVRWRPGGKA